MRNKFILICLLTAILILSFAFAGCDTGTGTGSSEPASTAAESKAEGETIDFDGVSYPKLEVANKNVKFLVHWDPNSPSYASHIERIKSVYDIDLETVRATYTQLPTKLASLQAAGDAPDVFMHYNAGFPSMFAKDMFLPVDDFVDFDDPFWASSKEASDKFLWNGKHYMAAGANISRVVWYNKSIFERNGLDTPLDLYDNGEWTWEALVDAAAELTQDTDSDGNVDQWGMAGNSFMSMMEASMDTAMVYMENNEIINNVMGQDIDFIMNLAYQISNIDKSFTWDWQNYFRAGKLAMVLEGTWITSGDEVLTQMLNDEEIGFVPHPMFEGSTEDRYYAEYSGYLIPKGAKNIPGAQAFVKYMRAYGRSDRSKEIFEESAINDGWSERMLEFYADLNYGSVPVLTGK
ncbi:MAG: extracellular solute-binding protein, partial [Bacilli bacterium]